LNPFFSSSDKDWVHTGYTNGALLF